MIKKNKIKSSRSKCRFVRVEVDNSRKHLKYGLNTGGFEHSYYLTFFDKWSILKLEDERMFDNLSKKIGSRKQDLTFFGKWSIISR